MWGGGAQQVQENKRNSLLFILNPNEGDRNSHMNTVKDAGAVVLL